MFSSNSGNQQELERTVRQIENARFSVDTLTEDVMHAGFYSEFNPNRADPPAVYTSPDPCATATTRAGLGAARPGRRHRRSGAAPVCRASRQPRSSIGCLANRRANTEALVIRRAETGRPDLADGRRAPTTCTSRRRAAGTNGGSSASPRRRPRSPRRRSTCGTPNCAAGNVNNAVRRLLQRTYLRRHLQRLRAPTTAFRP